MCTVIQLLLEVSYPGRVAHRIALLELRAFCLQLSELRVRVKREEAKGNPLGVLVEEDTVVLQLLLSNFMRTIVHPVAQVLDCFGVSFRVFL
ncbi:hypothetical protein DQ04_07681000 [Trypanosoma grayi]|uniref:hypothetical protein n=1 Tax=Trypanosoma grayi TaxID=71804 RepID=UPI0004F4301F|nr:hypothetical protein DQ04_07681000 [Trypanosoma grayi]KEG08224.1 hypothetical protein DQ04_07681000 [Trypanosoma grayi]